jgi:hypothetical protein
MESPSCPPGDPLSPLHRHLRAIVWYRRWRLFLQICTLVGCALLLSALRRYTSPQAGPSLITGFGRSLWEAWEIWMADDLPKGPVIPRSASCPLPPGEDAWVGQVRRRW